jgi:flavin-binding protein dodecin
MGEKNHTHGCGLGPHLISKAAKECHMSVAKVIEISAESNKGFEDAINQGIQKASQTVQNIKGAWVKEQQVVVEGNSVASYRVDLKVTFVLG